MSQKPNKPGKTTTLHSFYRVEKEKKNGDNGPEKDNEHEMC